MSYEGSCHCGAVAFTVNEDAPDSAISCNCSHCRRKGLLLGFVDADRFRIDRGEEMLETYLFNTHKIRHRFCRACGTEPFANSEKPGGGRAVAAVNLRCVPAIDLHRLQLHNVDGASL